VFFVLQYVQFAQTREDFLGKRKNMPESDSFHLPSSILFGCGFAALCSFAANFGFRVQTRLFVMARNNIPLPFIPLTIIPLTIIPLTIIPLTIIPLTLASVFSHGQFRGSG